MVAEFVSLDGVVQAPGGKDEDTDGGFIHDVMNNIPKYDLHHPDHQLRLAELNPHQREC